MRANTFLEYSEGPPALPGGSNCIVTYAKRDPLVHAAPAPICRVETHTSCVK